MEAFGEGLESLNLFLNLGDSGIKLIELFELEETIANGALEQDVEGHKVEV